MARLGLVQSVVGSVRHRFTALDDKLGHAMLSAADTNSTFRRELERVSRREYSKGRLLAGRHMGYILHRQLKIHEDLGT